MSTTLQRCRIEPIPGTPGLNGAAGANGAAGGNAYASLAAIFTMPAYGGTGTATLTNTAFLAVGEAVFIESAGVLIVQSITNPTVVLLNPADGALAYPDNIAPGSILPPTLIVTPSGTQGPAGASGAGGAPDTARYVLNEANGSLASAQSLGILTTGLVKNTVAGTVGTLSIAVDSVDYLSPSTGLIPADVGGLVQQFSALLDAMRVLGITANQIIYGTGVNTVALTSLTAFMRGLLGSATAAICRATLETNRCPQDIIILRDQKGSGTDGGTFTNGAWRTRELNTEVVDTGGYCTVAANQFTLANGVYRILASAPGHKVDHHQIRLFDVVAGGVVTEGGVLAYGMDVDADNVGDHATVSTLMFRFTVTAGPRAYEIQHQCQTTRATDGFGHANSFGGPEVYTEVRLEREIG